ncbi:MAG: LysM peptidoglycan-binding domain-containing protein, partial [Myxococcota bacterium]|nr:LysM peptidoglycan-binding domain-containing protein [Myxococcota bacterium]
MRSLVLLALLSTPALAGSHTVQRGETVEHVARSYHCSVESVLRANRLKTTLVKAGTVLAIPTCTLRTRARTRERVRPAPRDDTDRARQALAVVDGTT